MIEDGGWIPLDQYNIFYVIGLEILDQKLTFIEAVQQKSEDKHHATAFLSSLLPFPDNFALIAGWLRAAMTSQWREIRIPREAAKSQQRRRNVNPKRGPQGPSLKTPPNGSS